MYSENSAISRPYLSNGRAIGMVVVRLSVRLSVCNGCIVSLGRRKKLLIQIISQVF